MEPHMDHGPLHEQEPHHTSVGPGHHTVAEGDQGAQYHEKKSVFTKVKAKAKKMKDTLTGHGHGHDEEDDEDDQEKFEDPQIHDSPKYDSAASRTTAGQVDVDPLEPNVKPESNFHGQEGTRRQQRVTGSNDHRTKDNVPSSTVEGDLPHGPPFDPPGINHGRDNVPVKGDVLDPPGIHHHSSRDNVPSTRTSVAICDDNIVVRPGIHHNSRDDVPSRTTPQQDRSGQTKFNLERPKGSEEDFAAPKDSSGDYTSSNQQTKVTDPTGTGGEAAGVTSILQSFEKMKVKDGSEGMGKTRQEGMGKARQEHNLPAARNEDHLPTSVAPTGSHDQFSPELTSPKPHTAGRETFDSTKPQEHGHKPSNQSSSYTDKNSSPTTAIADKAISAKNVVGDKDNTTGVHDHEGVGGRPSSDQSGYTEKLSYATSTIADRAISAKNVVALKLGYGEKDNEVPGTGTFSTANQQQQQHSVEGNNQEKGGGGSVKGCFHDHEGVGGRPSSDQSGYTEKHSYATSAIADRASSAKNVVASKLGYGEKDNELPGTGTYSTANQQQQQHSVEGNNQEKGGGRSVKGCFHDEGVGGRPSSDQSGYTEKLSYATSAIADRAVSAKNVVASKLGYGEKDNEVPGTGNYSTANQQQQQHRVEGNNQEKGGGGSVKGYFHDHEGVGGRPSSDQSGYTEKLSYATSAIADRASSAKNVVASKLGYGEKDNEVPGTGTYSTANQQQQHCVEGNNQEKGGGIGSLKGYFAEKLKPGEEDKALSEVITESLHKRKPEQQQKQEAVPRPVGEVISDAMHKRNDDPDGEVNSRPMGKVTESEEVARRLGDTKDDQALGNKGMVEKIKGAVGSWLGTGDQSPGSQRSQPGPASDDTGHTSN